MPTYVEIAVNIPSLSGVFHYHLPPELEGHARPGHLVTVPFGSQQAHGVVLGFVDTPEVPETKAVEALVDAAAVLTPHQINLARRLAMDTLAPLAACISLMLPAGLAQQADTLYTVTDSPRPALNATQQRILAELDKRGPLRGAQLDHALPKTNWRPAARALVKAGVLAAQPILPPPRVRAKYIRTAQLSAPPEFVLANMQGLGSTPATQARRQKMLEFLLREPGSVDVNWVYAESGGKLEDLRTLDEKGLVMLREEEAWRDPLAGLAYDPAAPPALTTDQVRAWEIVRAGIESARRGQKVKPFLLHGVTGSGKTEIYLRAVAETLRHGKQAIVLVPEIALTPQTVRRFLARFPGRVGLVHSGLSEGERYDTWRRARAGGLSVIIGPRSALFTPLPDIGLIVVDEEHDGSYFQDNPLPYYHARRAALTLAGLTGAVCLLGSATPDAVTFARAQKGDITLLELPARILAHRETVAAYGKTFGAPAARFQPAGDDAEMTDLPPVDVVDMRAELKGGNSSIFSRALHAALAEVLQNKQQAILFLNRRGAATYVFCRDCGHILKCPRCETTLTLHTEQGDAGRTAKSKPADRVENAGGVLPNQVAAGHLICHFCGYSRQMPETCPNCQSPRIRHYGIGTQRVEEEVQTLFPDARLLRWDHETTRQKGAHEVILSHFTNHRADILIGTQMLAKGLDLPRVTLVGAVLADVGLTLPDPFAAERAFQVLAQVAGRAGRSPLGGRVILQTFQPEHPVIQFAAGHDYAGFIASELDARRALGYPPFAELVRLETRDRNPAAAQQRAETLAAQVKGWLAQEKRRATEIVGPAPCFFARIGGETRWQILLRGPDPAGLLRGRDLPGWRIEVGPVSLL
ncbi:MAG: primosomal protein N' [Anaerolineae bacterium]|nr:MAG: primosomal protein N' [Anaerolineae bacterium]